jgi:hypothetical protein
MKNRYQIVALIISLITLSGSMLAQGITVGAGVNFGQVNAQVGTTYTVVATDQGKLVSLTNASPVAVTLPQGTGQFGNGWTTLICNYGAGLVTITPNTSTINGGANITESQNNCNWIFSDGTNYKASIQSGGGSPGAPSLSPQYNNAGSFAGIPNSIILNGGTNVLAGVLAANANITITADVTQSTAVSITQNGVTIQGVSPLTKIIRSSTTALLNWSGTDGRLNTLTIDGGSQTLSGTGCLVCFSGDRDTLRDVNFQNTGNSNPTTASVLVTAGQNVRILNSRFLGSQTDRAVFFQPGASAHTDDGLIEGVFIASFIPSTAIYALGFDQTGSGATVARLGIQDNTILMAPTPGSCCAAGIGTSNAASPDIIGVRGLSVQRNKVYFTSNSPNASAAHLYGISWFTFNNNIFDDQGFTSGGALADLGDAYNGTAATNLIYDGGLISDALRCIDCSRNALVSNSIRGMNNGGAAGIRVVTPGQTASNNTVTGNNIECIGVCDGIVVTATGASAVANSNLVTGNQVHIATPNNAIAAHGVLVVLSGGATSVDATSIYSNELSGFSGTLDQAISTSAGVTNTILGQNTCNGATVCVSDSGTGTLPKWVHLTAQGANIGATTAYAIPANGGTRYRVCAAAAVTQAATTSSTLPNVNVIYTDTDSSAAVTTQITASSGGNTTATGANSCAYVNAKSSTNIQYSTTNYATSGATSMQYNLNVTVYKETL